MLHVTKEQITKYKECCLLLRKTFDLDQLHEDKRFDLVSISSNSSIILRPKSARLQLSYNLKVNMKKIK